MFYSISPVFASSSLAKVLALMAKLLNL